MVTSDHSYHLGGHGLWQKMTLFERCARVPLIIALPRATVRGAGARGLAELVDLYPTLAELAGLKPPPLDGVSLVPMLQTPAATVKDAAFTQLQNGLSIRTDRWRYSEWDEGKEATVLFDLQNDPGESTSRAQDPAHAATASELKRGWVLTDDDRSGDHPTGFDAIRTNGAGRCHPRTWMNRREPRARQQVNGN